MLCINVSNIRICQSWLSAKIGSGLNYKLCSAAKFDRDEKCDVKLEKSGNLEVGNCLLVHFSTLFVTAVAQHHYCNVHHLHHHDHHYQYPCHYFVSVNIISVVIVNNRCNISKETPFCLISSLLSSCHDWKVITPLHIIVSSSSSRITVLSPWKRQPSDVMPGWFELLRQNVVNISIIIPGWKWLSLSPHSDHIVDHQTDFF